MPCALRRNMRRGLCYGVADPPRIACRCARHHSGRFKVLMFLQDENPPHVHIKGIDFAAKVRILTQWVARSQKLAFYFIGRTDNQHSEASGVAFAYAGTSLCGMGLQCGLVVHLGAPVVMVTGNCADASCGSYSSP
jgi:hypothetical protein